MHTETTNEQPAKDNDQTHFGYQSVSADQKTRLVSDVFASVAENYDIMNDVMSGGVHRLWKARFVRGLGLRPGMRVLDLAGGTGDIGFAIAEQLLRRAARDGQDNGHQPPVTICDINPAMLAVGRDRAVDRGLVDAVTWSCGNAEDLPFDDREFDRVTISFGLRNVTHIDKALAEARRVLKPGGKFYCLEFSEVRAPGLRQLYDLYSFNLIPRFGQLVAKDRDSYQYLVESIRQFPNQKALVERMQNAGFKRCRYENLTGGVAAIHQGWRL